MAGQSAAGVMSALYVACQTLYRGDNALVTFGQPGEYLPDLVVAVMDCRAQIARPTMGTRRSREQAAEVDIIFSVFRSGGPDVSQAANDAAWAAAGELEGWLRVSPNETLGGACRDAYLANCAATPEIAWDHVDGISAGIPAGRTVTLLATVHADIRY